VYTAAVPKPPAKSKLYTRSGDRGETSLFGGRRVAKDHPRAVAYGTVDELNAALGVAVSFIRQRRVVAELRSIQNELFNVGAELASDRPVRRGKAQAGTFELGVEPVRRLEGLIDDYDARVPPLRTFVLPSGPAGAALLHLARTVCRRGERAVVTLARDETVNMNVIAYLNRLSDLLFAMARYLNRAARQRELLWQKDA